MALDPLAQTADLQVKGVDVTNTALVAMMLDVASTVIREAAGATISRVTSTVGVIAPQGRRLALPGPVIGVASVLIDGVATTDWKLVGGMLWRRCGWSSAHLDQTWIHWDLCEPVEVTVEYTHGLAAVPADIVNLCCDLVKLGIQEVTQEAQPAGAVSISTTIDDYTERIQWAEKARSVMELPDLTKSWLASRFGSGVHVTGELK